jgi:Putative peptidoglycan binding domain
MPVRADRRRFMFATSAVALFCLQGPSRAVAGLLLNEPGAKSLQAYADISVDYPVSALLLSDDGSVAYLAENDPKALTSVLHVTSVPNLREEGALKLEHNIVSMAFDPVQPGRVAVVGSTGEMDVLSLVDVKGGTVISVIAPRGQGVPVFAISPSGDAYLGNSGSNSVLFAKSAAFLRFDQALKARLGGEETGARLSVPGLSGIAKLSTSPDGGVLFASASEKPVVFALSTGKSFSIVGQIGSPGEQQSARLLPIAFDSSYISSSRSKSGQTSSFLLADVNQRRLVLADYNAVFSTFDIIADDAFDDSIPFGNLSTTGLPDSFVHVASDADQSAILVGSPASPVLNLYGRNGPTLQRLFAIKLSDMPQQVAIASDGGTALVLLRNGKLALLSSDPFEAPISSGNDPIFLGDDATRQLQLELNRLGFSVGAIDGMAGPRTRDAVQEAVKRLNLDPKLTASEPELVLEQLQRRKQAY